MNTMHTTNKNGQPSKRAMIADILARLEVVEKALATSSVSPAVAKAAISPPSTEAVVEERLNHLTLKRHAVLTATLGGVSYQGIAELMGCDLTTVKLHLKAALEVLGIRNRSFLLISWPDLLHFIPDQEYERRFGLSKRWWLTEKPELMSVLRATKPANNQHTK